MRQITMHLLCLGALALSACSFTPPAATPSPPGVTQAVQPSPAADSRPEPTARPAGAPVATASAATRPTVAPTLAPATTAGGAGDACAALATVDPQSEQGIALVVGEDLLRLTV